MRVPYNDHGWAKHTRLRELKAQVLALSSEIEADDQARARGNLKAIGPHQTQVLAALGDFNEDDWRAWSFKGLTRETGLTRDQVRRACKALRRLGFAKLEIGLWTEDGDLAGAGYRITQEGENWRGTLANADTFGETVKVPGRTGQ